MNEEDLTAIVLMPAVMREIWKHPEKAEDAEAFLKVCTAYKRELDQFVFKKKRAKDFYENFKEMLSRYSPIFQKDYPLIEFLENEEIDYVLKRVREERMAYEALEAEKLVKKL